MSSVEIERICNSVNEAILETAAIGVPPPTGGPEQLVVAIVFKDQKTMEEDLEKLRLAFNSALQKKLNPLFKVLASSSFSLPCGRHCDDLCFYKRFRLSFLCRLFHELLRTRLCEGF